MSVLIDCIKLPYFPDSGDQEQTKTQIKLSFILKDAEIPQLLDSTWERKLFWSEKLKHNIKIANIELCGEE